MQIHLLWPIHLVVITSVHACVNVGKLNACIHLLHVCSFPHVNQRIACYRSIKVVSERLFLECCYRMPFEDSPQLQCYNKAMSTHRKVAGEFLHDVNAINAIKIAGRGYCKLLYMCIM